MAMSKPEPVSPHLTRQELSEHDRSILTGMAGWLSTDNAQFKDNKGARTCIDKRLEVIREMDLAKKFSNPVFQVIRISDTLRFDPKPTPTSPPLQTPMSLAPVQIWRGGPAVSSDGKEVPLDLGWEVSIIKEVMVTPALDMLAIVSSEFKGPV